MRVAKVCTRSLSKTTGTITNEHEVSDLSDTELQASMPVVKNCNADAFCPFRHELQASMPVGKNCIAGTICLCRHELQASMPVGKNCVAGTSPDLGF